MRKIKAILKRPDEEIGHMTWISDSLENLQKTVGGYIETLTIRHWDVKAEHRKTFVVLCDEEGRLKGKPYNCTVEGISFVGDIAVVGMNRDEFDDCPLSFAEWKMILEESRQ